MLPSKLRNHDGPEYYLRPVDGNDAPRPQGSQYDARELETSLSVGHIYFHPGTRQPPIPPFADLQAFMVERPKLPIVVDRSNPQSPCEAPHIVLAQLHRDAAGEFALDGNGNPLIHLYTIAADNYSRAFHPATHVKGGEQKAGVDILDWTTVNFDPEYSCQTLRETFRLIYRDLLVATPL
jgi:hypothetical protein